MLLTESQFDAIMAEYEHTRQRNENLLEERRQEVYRLIPRYRTLDETVPEISLRTGRELLAGNRSGLADYRARMRAIADERRQLLASHNLPADYMDEKYDCALCRDTGFTEEGQCACLREKIRAVLREQSGLNALLADNCFEKTDLTLFEGEGLRRFKSALQVCRDFISRFDSPDLSSGILFLGPVGNGKSFLSIATAKELLNRGHSVLYFSAIDLFTRLRDITFGSGAYDDTEALPEDLTDCDLLIIDDLGTEMTNLFVSSQLFHLINTRDLRRHPTIISTNLTFEEISGRYSDRIFSRLGSRYSVCELTSDDVRMKIKKKRKERNLSCPEEKKNAI